MFLKSFETLRSNYYSYIVIKSFILLYSEFLLSKSSTILILDIAYYIYYKFIIYIVIYLSDILITIVNFYQFYQNLYYPYV